MSPFRYRVRLAAHALREASRVALTVFLACMALLAALPFFILLTRESGRFGPDLFSSVTIIVPLVGLPILAGLLISAPVIAALCLIGVPMERSIRSLESLARLPKKPVASVAKATLFDRDLDGVGNP